MQQKPAGFRGDWLTPDNPRFKEVVYDGMWNRLVPERLPAIVARVINDDDALISNEAGCHLGRRTGYRARF